MAFTFPDQVAQVPTQAQRSRRRASMQDALDHTKINTSLYDKVVSSLFILSSLVALVNDNGKSLTTEKEWPEEYQFTIDPLLTEVHH